MESAIFLYVLVTTLSLSNSIDVSTDAHAWPDVNFRSKFGYKKGCTINYHHIGIANFIDNKI